MYTTHLNIQHLLQGKPWAPHTQLMNSIKPRKVLMLSANNFSSVLQAPACFSVAFGLSLKQDPKEVVVQVVK